MAREGADRVGVGWRPLLAATILGNLDVIDVVEVLADEPQSPGALALLARRVPTVLHGTALGLSSVAPLDGKRLARLARLCEAVQPERWSEHLAFVRGGGREIGGLAAPSRTPATVEATLRNLEHARRAVGSAPLVENVATLIEPLGSTLDEPSWLDAILRGSGCGMLLDLHNLHANALNFGWSPMTLLERLPLEQVRMVHVAGGRWVTAEHTGGRRLLDDHRHAIPDAVYRLLTELARRAPGSLDVILERDGDFPPVAELHAELARCREALAAGRAMQREARL